MARDLFPYAPMEPGQRLRLYLTGGKLAGTATVEYDGPVRYHPKPESPRRKDILPGEPLPGVTGREFVMRMDQEMPPGFNYDDIVKAEPAFDMPRRTAEELAEMVRTAEAADASSAPRGVMHLEAGGAPAPEPVDRAALKAADQQFEEYTLTEAREHDDGWTLDADGMCFFIPKVAGIVPAAGVTVRYYGRGLGQAVRGVDVGGAEVFYRTEAEQDELHQQQRQADIEKRKATAEAERENTARRVAALPEVMRRRIQKFRDHNADFDWEFLPYELMCCEQAVGLAAALLTQYTAEAGLVPSEGLRLPLPVAQPIVMQFAKAEPEAQRAVFPGLDSGHSGNTFGFMTRLALWLLVDPEMAVQEHGALTPLVGCDDYGCPHPEPTFTEGAEETETPDITQPDGDAGPPARVHPADASGPLPPAPMS